MSMYSTIRDAAYGALACTPVLEHLGHRRLRGKVVALMYHEIAEDADDIEAWTVVKRGEFVRQMAYLRERFDIVSLAEAIARIGAADHGDKPMAVVTFDDGDSGNRRCLLPVIESLKLPVTIFIATQAVAERTSYWFDRVMNALQRAGKVEIGSTEWFPSRITINKERGAANWKKIQDVLVALKRLEPARREQAVGQLLENLPNSGIGYQIEPLTVDDVKQLAACPLVTIGAHSHCHNILTQFSHEQAKESISRSRELLKEWTGRPVKYFAYPNGDHSPAVVAAVKSAGFEAAMTVRPGVWTPGDGLFELPRFGVGRYDSFSNFKLKLVGGLRSSVR